MRAAIAQLPRKQRATLILRMYHEMSHQEIADVLGSSVGAVKANFFHALGNLKKLLGDEASDMHLSAEELVDLAEGHAARVGRAAPAGVRAVPRAAGGAAAR